MPRTLFAWIFPAIKPLERRILRAVESALPKEARDRFARQISTINRAQRHTDAKEVCYYRMKWGRPSFPKDAVFPAQENELKLATVRFRGAMQKADTAADVWLVQGYVFSITFSRPPGHLLNDDNIEITGCILHKNPMNEPDKDFVTPLIPVQELSPWLRSWHEEYGLSDVHKPVHMSLIQSALANLDATLPEDYVDLLHQVNGLTVDEVAVHGIAELREVTVNDGAFLVLAEKDNRGALVVGAHDRDGKVCFADYETGELVDSGLSFRRSVEQFLLL